MNHRSPHTKKDQRSSFLLPLLLFCCALFALFQLPRDNYLSPRPLNYKSRYENFYNNELPYVTVSVPELSSTGLEYQVNGLTRGNFYYTLHDGFCQFYLLNPSGRDASKAELTDLELSGRLIQLKDAEYEQLLSLMAEELHWSRDSLRRMTAPYAISMLPDSILFRQLFRLLICVCLILSLTDLLRILQQNRNKRTEH